MGDVNKRPGVSDTYLNPEKFFGDLGSLTQTQTKVEGDVPKLPGQIVSGVAQQNQAQVGQAKAEEAKSNKLAADKSRTESIIQSDLNSAMMDAQDKAERAKRGRNKLYGNRLDVYGGM